MCPRIASLTFLALLLAGTGFGADPKDKDKVAVPDSADQQKAEKTIKELFQAEYAKTKQADRLALANKLLMEADGSNDDPAAKYVLLRETRDIAAKAGDAGLAMTAADAMAATFDVKPAVIKVEALELMRPGDEWVLYVPPKLGYGDVETGQIPANSVLVFRMQLLDVLPPGAGQ